MGLAAELLPADRGERLAGLTSLLESELAEFRVEGTKRAPGVTMLTSPTVAPGWLRRLSTVACSGGSSCASGQATPSHSLAVMGVPEAEAANALRLSIGIDDDEATITELARRVCAAA
jgi:cysteine desulfurase